MKSGKIDRRRFLRNAAGTALGAIGFPYIVNSSALGADGGVAPSERIVMGCVGLGGQGTYNMQAFMGISGVQVVAICDVDNRRMYPRNRRGGLLNAKDIVNKFYSNKKPAGSYKGVSTYRDFRDLLQRDDIDAVTVCTPDHWHGLISVAAAEAGKDIYCEKPLANTVAESRAIVDAVDRYKRVLQTGSHERSNDKARFACELVRNGRIGKLHTIRVNMPTDQNHHLQVINTSMCPDAMPVPDGFDYDMWLGHTPKFPYTELRSHFWWRFILEYGGGEMTDRGAHIIDLGQLGNDTDDTGPVELSARGWENENGIFDSFMKFEFECRYADGVRLIGQSAATRGVKFEGTDGWVFIHIHGGHLEAEPASLLREKIGVGEVHLGRSPGHHQDFIESVKTRRQPMASAMIGHRTATICHLLNIGMQMGVPLKWDPEAEQITNDAEANRMLSRPMRSPWHL